MGLGFGYDVVSERFIQPPEDYSLLHTAPNDEMWAGLGCMCVSSLLSQVYCRLMVIFTDWLCVLEIFRKIVLINKLCVRSWTISFAECSSSRGGGDVHVHVHTHITMLLPSTGTRTKNTTTTVHTLTQTDTHTHKHTMSSFQIWGQLPACILSVLILCGVHLIAGGFHFVRMTI